MPSFIKIGGYFGSHMKFEVDAHPPSNTVVIKLFVEIENNPFTFTSMDEFLY